MSIDSQQYISSMEKIQENILAFLENEADDEEIFQNLQTIFLEQKIIDDQNKLKSILHLICKISDSYHYEHNFFDKIDQILSNFKNDIKKHFSNDEIFNIFKSNKRILLFLIDEQIIVINESIVKIILNKNKYSLAKYPQYFAPELRPFINKVWMSESTIEKISKEIPENFYQLRKIGEDDKFICNLVRKDMKKEFIIYINRNSACHF